MDPPPFGWMLCDIVDGKHICTAYCMHGYVLDVMDPGQYFTCIEGEWSPAVEPVCMGGSHHS